MSAIYVDRDVFMAISSCCRVGSRNAEGDPLVAFA